MKTLRVDWIIGLLWLAGGTLALAVTNEYHALVIGTVACTAMVGIGLNVLMGLAGQTSLGHAAFYAIGAYTSTILATRFGVQYIWTLLAAAAVSGAAGAFLSLPALRVKGPYLAMVTIAFGYFVEQGIADWKDVTGGWNGIMNIPHPNLFGYDLSSAQLAWVAVLLVALLVPAFSWLAGSRWGIVMRATRDAEVAASSLGANLMAVRVIAFSISAAITGVAGSFFASLNGFISPESFPFFQSITFLLMVMIGGVGMASGPLAGALAVILLPEALSSLAEYRLLFFGALLLIVLLIAPNGMVGGLTGLLRRYSPLPAPHLPVAISQNEPLWFSRSQTVDFQISDLGITFGGNQALAAVTLTLGGGYVTSLIGPNGAGKTSLLNLITGFYTPSSGSFSLGNLDLTGLPGYRIGRSAISRSFQTSQLFGDMTVLENVMFGMLQGKLWGSKVTGQSKRHCETLLNFVGFAGDVNAKASSLAHVDRRLLEIARALASRPAMLLLDEPAAGLSAEEKQQLGVIIKRIAQAGVGVLIVEHDMALVMGISHRIHVLDAGRLIASGTPDEVKLNPKVKAAYLGDGQHKFHALVEDNKADRVSTRGDVLVVGNLCANYGAADVLHDVNLSVGYGQTVCVLGANGAGKSSLMRVISGLHQAFRGAVAFDGQDISNMPAHRIAALGLVMVPEGRQVFTELSVQDNIMIGAHTRGGLSTESLESLYLMFPKLKAIRTRRAGLLSGGEQQMLAVARGLAASPRMMLLDEPSLGLAPAIVEDLFMTLARLRRDGMTLLLVDQMADMAMALSDRANLLNTGVLVFSGTPEHLRQTGHLDRAYLG